MTYTFFPQHSLSERKTYYNKPTLLQRFVHKSRGGNTEHAVSTVSALLLMILNLVLARLKHVVHYLIRFPILLYENISEEC